LGFETPADRLRAVLQWPVEPAVKSGHDTVELRCLLYPRKRTLPGATWMSALCH